MIVNRYYDQSIKLDTLVRNLIELEISNLVNNIKVNSPTSHDKNHLGGV